MLTARGWSVGLIAVGLILSGATFGIQEFYPLAVAAIILLGVAAAWVHGRGWRLDTERRTRPTRVAAGANARVELTVRNRDKHKSPVLTARDPFDGGRRHAVFALAPLEPNETLRAAYRLPTAQRGIYPLGPLELELSDPFGLVRISRPGASASLLTVYPRVDQILPLPASAGTERRGSSGSPILGVHGEEFYAIREYRTGDDLRRVHWSSTARLDELMIRQDETLWRGRITVVADLRSNVFRSASLEIAMSAAASVADTGFRGGLQVRLVTTGRTDSGFGSSSAHRATILDQLAAARQHPTAPLGALLSPLTQPGAAGNLVVVTSDHASDADLRSVGRLGAHHRSLTLVVVDPAAGEGHDHPATSPGVALRRLPSLRARVVRVDRHTPFATTWDRVMTRSSQTSTSSQRS